MGLMQEPLFTGTNDPSSTLNGTQRWLTPSLNEIASMLDKVEGKIRKEDDEWVAIAQSVANQQNAYAAYQADMKKKGVTDQKHDSYKPFAIWARGETVTKDYSDIYSGPKGRGDGKPPVTGALEAGGNAGGPSPVTGALEAGGPSPVTGALEAGGPSPVTGALEAGGPGGAVALSRRFSTLKDEELLFIRDQKAIKPEYRMAVTEELLRRNPDMKLAYPDQNLETIVDLVGKKDFDTIYAAYGRHLMGMKPEERRAYLRTEFGDGARSAARFIRHSVDTQRYKRAGNREEELSKERLELLSDLDNFEAAQRGNWADNLALGVLDNLPWIGSLVKHGFTKHGRSIADLDDILTDADFADTCEVLSNEVGTVGSYLLIAGLFSKAIDSMGKSSKKGSVSKDEVSVKAYVRAAKKPPNMSASSPGVVPETPSVVPASRELSAASGHGNLSRNYTGMGSNPIINQHRESIREGYINARNLARKSTLQHDLNKRLGVTSIDGKPSSFSDMVDPTKVAPHVQQMRAINHIEATPELRTRFLSEPTLEGRNKIIDDTVKFLRAPQPSPIRAPIPAVRPGQPATTAPVTPVTPAASVTPVAPASTAVPKVAQAVPTSTSPVTPLVSNKFTIPEVFNKFKNTAEGREIFKSGMMGKSTQLTQEIIDTAARTVQDGGRVTNSAVKQALLAAARMAAPTAMAAGAYYSQEAEDAMSQIAEQLSALGLD